MPVHGTWPPAPATTRPNRRNFLREPRHLPGLSAIGRLSDARLLSVGDRFGWSDVPRCVATDATGRPRFAPSPGGPPERHRERSQDRECRTRTGRGAHVRVRRAGGRERHRRLRRPHPRLAGVVQMAITRDYSVTEDDFLAVEVGPDGDEPPRATSPPRASPSSPPRTARSRTRFSVSATRSAAPSACSRSRPKPGPAAFRRARVPPRAVARLTRVRHLSGIVSGGRAVISCHTIWTALARKVEGCGARLTRRRRR